MNRSPWAIIPAVVLSAGLFAACGSSSYSGSATTKAAAAADTTVAETATTKAATGTKPAAVTTPAAGTTATAATTAGTAGAGAGAATSIDVKSFAFSPAKLSVKAGTDVAVKNEDSFEHTITSDDGKAFNVDLPGGGTGTVKGVAAGTYKYHCAIHPSMTGTLTVA